MVKKGKVFIVGAGPGDPGLITLKGLRSLAGADVVVYDYLASEDILRFAGKDARLIYVGKKGGDHTLPQGEINTILVDEARKGNKVARLKGGDPFIFGRGGEEAEVLQEAGIPFEVIPGVTSAISVPAFAGIPLTHRGYTSTVAFVTGHEDPTKEKSDVDWSKLSGIGTLVFLMGVKNLANITRNLIAGGKSPETPAALIRWGTTPEQETLTGTLADIASKAKKQGFKPPSILVVGEVVLLRDKLDWFEKKPLFGKGIVVTRPEKQAGEFANLLAAEAARVILFPTIRIVPPATWEHLDRALGNLGSFHWIVFTSANGVRHFFRRLRETGRDVRDLKGIRICTIGPATAAAVEGMGIRVDIVPDEYISEGVVKALQGVDLQGKRILLPRAEEARDVIPEGLAKRGASVEVVAVYRTVRSESRKETLQAHLDAGEVDVITFTSPSTVNNFKEIMGAETLPGNVLIACIGPVTAAAAKKLGLTVNIFQEEFTIPGMVQALVDYFATRK
ncbi:MAG TPA: uroporphyrinogen-III C-methyltransferase [Syntrophales bacterium]|nr:uroporphyrinogen-III C-methyltransferase [Syntrophales bacterium]